jgi:hypothetical protein
MMDRSRFDIARSAKVAVTEMPKKIIGIGGKFILHREDLYKIKNEKNNFKK